MVEKTIGVISPRNELHSLADKKNEAILEKKDEFQKYLDQFQKYKDQVGKSSLGEYKKSTKTFHGEKKPEKKTDELEEESKKGVVKKKKKQVEPDKMALNGTASKENVIKALDSEDNLDDLKSSLQSEDTQSVSVEELMCDSQVKPEEQLLNSTQEKLLSTENHSEIHIEADQGDFQTELSELNEDPQFKKQTETIRHLNEEIQSSSAVTMEPSSGSIETIESAGSDNFDHQKEFSHEHSSSEHSSDLSADQMKPSIAVGNQEATSVFNKNLDVQNSKQTQKTETEDSQDQMNEILKQAKYLVTQGGGEVSVKMSPEGMGEVHLKVMMENGRMSLEMNTDDKTVEKLIHKNLSELRSSLAEQQIQIEHVTLNSRLNHILPSEQSQKSDAHQNSSFSQGQNQFSDQSQSKFGQSNFSNNERRTAVLQMAEENKNSIKNLQVEIKKMVGNRIYQSHKAQSLDRIA